MAIKFNSKKYEQVKSEYIKFLHEGVANSNAMNNFKNYKLFLEEDNEIKAIRDEINRSQKIKVSINVINSPKKSYKHQSNNNYPLYTKEEFSDFKKHIESSFPKMTVKECRGMIKLIQKKVEFSSTDKKSLIKIINKSIVTKNTQKKLDRKRKLAAKKWEKIGKTNAHFSSVSYSSLYNSRGISNYK